MWCQFHSVRLRVKSECLAYSMSVLCFWAVNIYLLKCGITAVTLEHSGFKEISEKTTVNSIKRSLLLARLDVAPNLTKRRNKENKRLSFFFKEENKNVTFLLVQEAHFSLNKSKG